MGERGEEGRALCDDGKCVWLTGTGAGLTGIGAADDVARPGVDVYEEEEDVFYRDLSADVLHDDMLTRLMVRSPGPRIIALDVQLTWISLDVQNVDWPVIHPFSPASVSASSWQPPLIRPCLLPMLLLLAVVLRHRPSRT